VDYGIAMVFPKERASGGGKGAVKGTGADGCIYLDRTFRWLGDGGPVGEEKEKEAARTVTATVDFGAMFCHLPTGI